jgi:hypothetical protein
MGEGGFHLAVHGSEEGVDNNQLGTAGHAAGSFADSLIITGASGDGSLLLPLHVTGSSAISFGLTSLMPPQAGGYFRLTCSSVAFVAFSCADETLSFDAAQVFDTTLTATVPFTFGDEVAFSRGVDAAAGFVTPTISATPRARRKDSRTRSSTERGRWRWSSTERDTKSPRRSAALRPSIT